MTTIGKAPANKSIRIPDDLWQSAKDIAAVDQTTAAAMTNYALAARVCEVQGYVDYKGFRVRRSGGWWVATRGTAERMTDRTLDAVLKVIDRTVRAFGNQ